MTQTYSPGGEPITRPDGSTVYPVVYLDSDGAVAGKAHIPEWHEPDVPDHVDVTRAFTVEPGTDLANKVVDSNANIPDNPAHDPAETPKEKLENVVIDPPYRPE